MRARVWGASRNRRLRDELLEWYDRNKRALPWRSDPSPYRVWLSEVMLQQTQVATVLPYFERFLRRFPDLPSLAAAREEDVLALWAGLGYYTRGRNLLRTARKIVEEHGGEFPRDLDEILALPGIGRYTAGAIQSIAFNMPAPVVDGNVKRVIARLHGAKSELPEDYFWNQSKAWVPAYRPADFNQAVMELGALVCVPKNPACEKCPVRRLCAARKRGLQDEIPPPRQRRRSEEVVLVVLVARHGDQVLLSRQERESFVPGIWGLPSRRVEPSSNPDSAAATFARELFRRETDLSRCGPVHHAITYRKIVAHVFEVDGRPTRSHHWVKAEEARRLLTSSLFRKILDPRRSA